MNRSMVMVAVLGAVCIGPVNSAEKPNVLLISIDDLNDWIGALGGQAASSYNARKKSKKTKV